MNDELPVLQFSNELEDAGWLGLASHSLLTIIYLAEGQPGAFSSTDEGFVWTKSLEGSGSRQEMDFGIGKLVFDGALLSATLGVKLTDNIPSHIDIMFSVLGEGASPGIYLEISPDIAVFANKVLSPDEGIPENRTVIAYEYEDAANPERVRLPVPMAAIEFSFRINSKKGIQSSVQIYESLSDLASAANGIIEFDMDKVIVFPKLGNLGLYIDKLFLDLSSTGTTSFAGLFPEVYDPTWKGLGAKEITLLFPVKDEPREFIAAGVDGFLLGFDGLFSGSFNFNYTNDDENADIKWVRSELQIRKNEFIQTDIAIGFNLEKALDKMEADASNQDTSSGNADEQSIANTAQENVNAQPRPVSFNGILEGRVDLVWLEVNGKEILGFDIIFNSVNTGPDSTQPAGVAFQGDVAKAMFWSVGFAAGIYMLVDGIEKDDNKKIALGVAILILVLADMTVTGATDKTFLPELKKLTLNKTGFRFVRINIPAESIQDDYIQFLLSFRTEFEINGVLIEFLAGIGSFLLTGLGAVEDLFGETVDKIKIQGKLDLEFDNISIQNKPLPGFVSTIFEQRDFAIRAKKIPEIVFEDSDSEEQSSFPKPVVGVEFINRLLAGTTDPEYGLAIKLEGLTSSAFKLDTPAVGIVAIFWPQVKLEFLPQVTILPRFTFVVPGALLAEGVIDLDKPLPAFGGTQNRISLDVGVISTVASGNMEDFLKLSKYKYRFGGEVVWGEATHIAETIERQYDFLFVEVHYSGDTPLAVIGPVGLFGLGLIFGRNIRPGVQGGQNSAMGIANWIIGQRLLPDATDDDIFKNVRDWPAIPAADGSTWHPAINYNTEANTFDDQFAIGLTVKIGSPADAGESYKGEVIVLVGFPEFWFAIGGIVSFKKVNAEVVVVIVYDRNTFAIKLIFEISVDEEGNVVTAKIPFELGVVSEPSRFWMYIGHYDESRGSPVTLRFLKGLFTVKGYFVADTAGLDNFGLIPVGDFARPDLSGTAIGFGVMIQLGPKKYGPDAINIKLFAALGLNVGFTTKPFIAFGEIYAGGYVALKILFLEAKLELLLLLGGMSTDDGYRYVGLFAIKLGLPWPIPDFEFSCDFVIQSDNFLPLPDPMISTTANGLRRLAPPETIELGADDASPLPIDGIISIAFDKSILEIDIEDAEGIDKTQLLLNNENPDDDKVSEQIETDYQGVRYLISLVHIVESVTITRRPLTGGATVQVEEINATWAVPGLYDSGEPGSESETNKTLFINSLFPPHLQFATEELDRFNTWRETREHVFPCEYPGQVCINREPRPALNTDGIPELGFETDYGSVTIREDGITEEEALEAENTGLLGWESLTVTVPVISLPRRTHMDLPYPDKIQFIFLFVQEEQISTRDISQIVLELQVEIIIKLRGKDEYNRLILKLLPDNTVDCGWRIDVEELIVYGDILSLIDFSGMCIGNSSVAAILDIATSNFTNRIDFIKINGYSTIFNPVVYGSWSLISEKRYQVINWLDGFKFLLGNLCIENTQHSSRSWETSRTTNDILTNPAEAVDIFTDRLLFEPDNEYTINYQIRSFASIYHIDEKGTNLVQETDKVFSTTDDDSGIQAVQFTTEATPSHDIERYLGFTYPMPGMQAPYPASLAPFITLKYQGMIKNIYKKYYGRDVLFPVLVDIDGNELAPALEDTLTLQSSSSDQALQELLSTCLPNAEDFVKLQISVWQRTLQTDTRYSLQLKDESNPDSPKIPFTISFNTSIFPDLSSHVTHVESLFNAVEQDPLFNVSTFSSECIILINNILFGSISGFDESVEKFYFDFMGVEGGRLNPLPTGDYASYLVGINSSGESEIWGFAIESGEPLLGKEGISIAIKPGFESHALKGIYVTDNDLCLIRDRSGSRVIILNSADLTSFQRFTSDITLDIAFSTTKVLRASIENYISINFPDLDDTEQNLLINTQLSETMAIPDISGAMTSSTSTLTIEIPTELFMTTLWRSKAFSALGAGFKADDTLHDGIHLKWMFDPRYGLPVQQNKQKATDDGFYIYKLNKKIPCLKQVELIKWVGNSNIPVFSEANNSPDGRIFIAEDNKYFFLHKAETESNRFVQKLKNQIRAIRKWETGKVETEILSYLNDITKTLGSDLHKPAPSLEKAEVCAIDIRFSVGTGFNPVGDGSGNSGCLGILVSAFIQKTYA
ncbi:MAG: hypothetical protein GXP18_11590, partial [Gammaproteobacteria bacterium]|nr:hypothetical protein [Gammaproteobacteria bacterium]